MCNNPPAPTSPWLILAHQCKYYNIACLPANCPKTTQLSPESDEVPAQQLTDATSTAYEILIHLQPLSSPTVTEIFIPCDTLNTPATLSYWDLKQNCCHTVIQISSFHSSKTYLLASGFYLHYHHRRHTLVSTSSLPQQSGATATPEITGPPASSTNQDKGKRHLRIFNSTPNSIGV